MIDSVVVGAIATNCWIIALEPGRKLPGEQAPCVVVDPGGDPEAIIACLKRRRLRPAAVVLTHGHFDHLAALPALLAAFRPAPDVLVHPADRGYLGPGALQLHRRDFALAGAASYVDGLWAEMPAPARLVEEGDRVGPFKVLHTPGHTPGSICLYDEGGGRLFSGDTLFAGGVGRTDLPGGDARALGSSLDRLLALPPDVRVHPGHGPETRIDRARRDLGGA